MWPGGTRGVARRGEGCGLEGSFPSGVRGSTVFSRNGSPVTCLTQHSPIAPELECSKPDF